PSSNTSTQCENLPSDLSPEHKAPHFRTNDRHRSLPAPGEELMPGLAYVALAGVTGSLLARQRGMTVKMLAPVAFASAAGLYFLPHTTRNLLGVDSASYDKWTATHPHSHAHGQLRPHNQTPELSNTKLVSQARTAWDSVQDKAGDLDDKVSTKGKEAKTWWNKNTDKVEGTLKTQAQESKSWVENKVNEADRAIDNASAKAAGAAKGAVDWVEDKSKITGPKLEVNTKDADAWRQTQGRVSKDTNGRAKLVARLGEDSSRTHTENSWLRREFGDGPEETYSPHLDRNRRWSGRSSVSSMNGSCDYWSDGQEQGTAKVRGNDDYWFRKPPNSALRSNKGALNNSDVDRWSSTGDEIGTARMDDPKYENLHRQRSANAADLPHKPEYWTNGEEISSADIRDANYYNYPGSHTAPSLGRASWWFRHTGTSSLDYATSLANLTGQGDKESFAHADHFPHDISSKLATMKAELEKAAADIMTRAEDRAAHAKAAGEAAIHDRKTVMEKGIKDLEQRLAVEKESAERAVKEAKARAQSWERDHSALAEKAVKDIADRFAHDKAAAEASAAQLKSKAEAWAREQKERVDTATKEVHDRVIRETAATEKNAAEVKTALETRIREEKLKMEREIEESIRLEKVKEEKAKADLRAKNEAVARDQKLKLEKGAKELEEKLSFERAQEAAQEARARAEAVKAAKEKEMRLIREREEAAIAERKRAAEHAVKERADKLALEKAERAAHEARTRAEALELEKKKHTVLAAKEMEHMKEVERAETAARDAKSKAEEVLLEKRMAGKKDIEMEGRLSAERAQAVAREAKAHAETMAIEQKMTAQRAKHEREQKSGLEQAEAGAREARIRADALVKEMKMSKDRVDKEIEQKIAAERAEAAAMEARTRAEATLNETERTVEHDRKSRTGWSWPWSGSRSSTTTVETTTETTSVPSKGAQSRAQSREGSDTTDHPLKHTVEDTKQTKENVEGGLERLKQAVLGTESKISDDAQRVKETVRNKVEATAAERRGVFSQGAKSDATSDVGLNVQAAAAKAGVEIKAGAKDQYLKNSSETARKAYDNVIDAATTVEGQILHPHLHHEHTDGDAAKHHLHDHVRGDLRQAKEDTQHGYERLKGATTGAEEAPVKATNDGKRWWSDKAEQLDQELDKTQAKVEKSAGNTKGWWNSKTNETEDKAKRMDKELRDGLNKAGDKSQEMNDDTARNADAADGDSWFRTEQARQHQHNRGPGRAM
ncbi:hypothetical protein BGZ54_002879, partial [Gamsiella multidivaricata]